MLNVLFLLLPAGNMLAQSRAHTWDVVELTLTAYRTTPNPYAEMPVTKDGLVKCTFTGTDGAARGSEISVFGFWDGGKTWKIRFAPPREGTWTYRTSSSDRGLNNKRGKIVARDWLSAEKEVNETRRGFVQVMQEGDIPGRYFQYADGTPFLWVGDTWWNWTKRGIHFSTWKKLVDDRAAKGFTVGQLFVPANGWGRIASLLDSTYSVPDIKHLQRVDSMIQYANSKGITVWVHGWWARKDLDKTAGPEKMKRWWRYLVHRLGAYNVIWVIGGEYNMNNYGGLGLAFWKDLGQLIKEEDPYRRITGAHNTPPNWNGGKDAPQWSTAEILHNEPWLDYNQTQVGHGRMANEMIPDVIADSYKTAPAKPVVVTEPWYEFVEGNPTGMDIRFGAWSAMLSGAAGHTYGGGHVWLAYVPESAQGGGTWPLEKSFERNTLDYEGAVSMGHFSRFFRAVEYWKMEPHTELVKEYPDPYCLALPGHEYIIYLRWGGTVKVDLTAAGPEHDFMFRWFDPSTGTYRNGGSVKGGEVRFFSAPGGYPGNVNYHDYVLHIKRK